MIAKALNKAQSAVASTAADTCTIQYRAKAKNVGGRLKSDWCDLECATDIACHYAEALGQQSKDDRGTYTRIGHKATVAVYVDISEQVTTAMRIVYREQCYPILKVIRDYQGIATVFEISEATT